MNYDFEELIPRRREPITVTALNEYIKALLDGNDLLRRVSIRGEISNFKLHSSGHLYFSLKDDGGAVRAVMFRSAAAHLTFRPENGMKVTAEGNVSLFVRDGSYQLYVTALRPDGVGSLWQAYEKLKEKLNAEGLFSPERKRPLPQYPRVVGVITSPTGGAVRDILHILGRRWPMARVLVYPAVVQGPDAPASLVAGLSWFARPGAADTLIIGRGGGSIEDLWAFNDEGVARAVAASPIPVISAVGHETDFTICDFVADCRAPTPSAAAELAVPDKGEIARRITDAVLRAGILVHRAVGERRAMLSALIVRPPIRDPQSGIREKRMCIASLSDRCSYSAEACLGTAKSRYAAALAGLRTLDPMAVLARGYTVVEKDGLPIMRAAQIRERDEVSIGFADGRVRASVIGLLPGRPGEAADVSLPPEGIFSGRNEE